MIMEMSKKISVNGNQENTFSKKSGEESGTDKKWHWSEMGQPVLEQFPFCSSFAIVLIQLQLFL